MIPLFQVLNSRIFLIAAFVILYFEEYSSMNRVLYVIGINTNILKKQVSPQKAWDLIFKPWAFGPEDLEAHK